MARGRFITIEGGEGAGKSTQARLMAEHLAAVGIEAIITREPGGSPFAEAIREIVLDPSTPPHAQLAEALLFNAARADHLERTIRPALARGCWVICDRFVDSTRVYQGEVGGLDGAVLDALDRIVVAGTMPDLTIMIDLDPVVGLARVEQRRLGGVAAPVDRYEAQGAEFHSRLREGFLRVAHSQPGRCVVVNGFRSVDAIAAEIRGHVDARLLRQRSG